MFHCGVKNPLPSGDQFQYIESSLASSWLQPFAGRLHGRGNQGHGLFLGSTISRAFSRPLNHHRIPAGGGSVFKEFDEMLVVFFCHSADPVHRLDTLARSLTQSAGQFFVLNHLQECPR